MSLLAGARLGPYKIVSPLGAGGMGEVYRARDTRLGRDVAIKVLPASFSTDHDRLRRFEQEARAASALNHPAGRSDRGDRRVSRRGRDGRGSRRSRYPAAPGGGGFARDGRSRPQDALGLPARGRISGKSYSSSTIQMSESTIPYGLPTNVGCSSIDSVPRAATSG
jgi:hypothetical protein